MSQPGQRNLLLISVIKFQFTYSPLIWMFTLRYLNSALNNIHERSLRLIYNHLEKSFNSTLTENNLKTIHQKNFEFLAVEIYKFQNSLSLPIINDIFFSRQNIYNLRKFQIILDPFTFKKTMTIFTFSFYEFLLRNYGQDLIMNLP